MEKAPLPLFLPSMEVFIVHHRTWVVHTHSDFMATDVPVMGHVSTNLLSFLSITNLCNLTAYFHLSV